MAKSILISIKPRYVADILNHKKTIEVRKVMPKCNLPIDVYIYCTKDKKSGLHYSKEYGAFNDLVNNCEHYSTIGDGCGYVVAKFTLNKVENIFYNDYYELFMSSYLHDEELCKKSCVSQKDMADYFGTNGGNCGYAWHISNLEIFDKPKELSEFYKPEPFLFNGCWECPHILCDDSAGYSIESCELDKCEKLRLTKAPMSWCYVEV